MRATTEKARRLINGYGELEAEELAEIAESKNRPMIEVLTANMWLKAPHDNEKAKFLFDHIVGKPVQPISTDETGINLNLNYKK